MRATLQRAQHVHAAHVRQVEVQQDEVVVVDLAEIDAFLTQVRGVDVEALGPQRQVDAFGHGLIVLDQQYAHLAPSPAFGGVSTANESLATKMVNGR